MTRTRLCLCYIIWIDSQSRIGIIECSAIVGCACYDGKIECTAALLDCRSHELTPDRFFGHIRTEMRRVDEVAIHEFNMLVVYAPTDSIR